MKDLLLRMLAVFTLAVVAPVLLAADQEAADQSTEAELQRLAEQWSDAAFNNYVNLGLLSRALATGDASRLTDAALQFLKAEEILLRSHQAVSAEDLVLRAARLAGERRDLESLDRLARATESLKNEKANAAIDAARKQAQESPSASSAVSVKDTSVEEFATYKQLLDQLRAAAVVGDPELRKQTRTAVEESDLSKERKESLLKSIDQSRPEEAMNDALSKLASVSRDEFGLGEGNPNFCPDQQNFGGGGGESYGGGGGGFDVGGLIGGLLGGGGESYGGGGGESYGGGGGESYGGGREYAGPSYQPQPSPVPSSPAPAPQPLRLSYSVQLPPRLQPAPTTKSSNPFARTQPSPEPSSPAPAPQPLRLSYSVQLRPRLQPAPTTKSSNPFARTQPTPEASIPAPKPQPVLERQAVATLPPRVIQPLPPPTPEPHPATTATSTNPFAKISPPKPQPQDPPCGDPSKPLGLVVKTEADARRCVESGQAHMVKDLVSVIVTNPTSTNYDILCQVRPGGNYDSLGELRGGNNANKTVSVPKDSRLFIRRQTMDGEPESFIAYTVGSEAVAMFLTR